jgi:serine beta-lactamase-like protein LACTB, mitochondrial
MSKSRTHTVVALIIGAVGLLIAAILGLLAYISATATPLHPDPQLVRSAAQAATLPEWAPAVKQSQQLVRASLVAQNLPGLSVAVGAGSDVVWAEGFGWADLENRVGVTPKTRFRIAGASMALTSVAVGVLLEKGQLKLDEPIQTYVPDFPPKQWPVTLRQLMGHVAGVSPDEGDEEPLSPRCEQTVDGLQRFADGPLLFEPGTRYRYSTYGWILVSAAVEAAAHEPFLKVMRTQVFEPLGMDATKADSAADAIPDRATFYHPRFAGDPHYGPELAREGDYACFAGGGAFLSTPSDLVRFGLAITGGTLLQPATITLLQTPQRLASGEATGYGLGWDLETVSIAGHPTRQVGHDGEFILGGSTSFITLPERGIVVAVTTNISFADTSSVALSIARAFAEQEKGPARR